MNWIDVKKEWIATILDPAGQIKTISWFQSQSVNYTKIIDTEDRGLYPT